jgi:hypothetical protein
MKTACGGCSSGELSITGCAAEVTGWDGCGRIVGEGGGEGGGEVKTSVGVRSGVIPLLSKG